MAHDYSAVTEAPGGEVTAEALQMIVTRYHVAAEHSSGQDVLEVGAGAGMGLPLMARAAKRVVGIDITPALTREARAVCGSRIPVATADAERLPFKDASFDVIALFEAVYYLPDVDAFFREAHRVLRPGGVLLTCSANRRRLGFVRSPHAVGYYDRGELLALHERHGFTSTQTWGAFAQPRDLKARALLAGFATADALHLIPRSLEGRARFKRRIYGGLSRLPQELEPHMIAPAPLVEISSGDARHWKVIYTLSRRT